MLYKKNDSDIYISEFKKRFSNFAEKSPLLLSMTITPNHVSILNEDTGTVYEFDWNFIIPVKKFIFLIKKELIPTYPKLIYKKIEKIPLTEEEQFDLIKKGVSVDNLPSEKEVIKESKLFMIEKVILNKDIIILRELPYDYIKKEITSNDIFSHKKLIRFMLPKSTLFLKKARDIAKKNFNMIDIKDLENLGMIFFSKAKFMNVLESKDY